MWIIILPQRIDEQGNPLGIPQASYGTDGLRSELDIRAAGNGAEHADHLRIWGIREQPDDPDQGLMWKRHHHAVLLDHDRLHQRLYHLEYSRQSGMAKPLFS